MENILYCNCMPRKGDHFMGFQLHTYIHNWPLQPFSQDYGLDSHTTYVVCVNFIRRWWGPTV